MHPHENIKSHYEYVLPIKEEAFSCMQLLEGWCSQNKASILIDYILKTKPTKIVEIGVFGGKSLIPMAIALRVTGQGKIYGIDPWDAKASIQGMLDKGNRDWWLRLDYEEIRNALICKIEQLGLQNQVELIQSTSSNCFSIHDIDILHLDGNHSNTNSFNDVNKWVPLVKVGGLIILNDMHWSEKDALLSMQGAIDWLNEWCHKIAEFTTPGEDWGIWVKK